MEKVLKLTFHCGTLKAKVVCFINKYANDKEDLWDIL